MIFVFWEYHTHTVNEIDEIEDEATMKHGSDNNDYIVHIEEAAEKNFSDGEYGCQSYTKAEKNLSLNSQHSCQFLVLYCE